MGNKLFSVITVVRNDIGNIGRTIESVLSQDTALFEYIVIDGASTDGTTNIIEDFRPQIECVLSEPDSGIYNAMNKGIRLAKGDYSIFMNSGDTFADSNVLASVASELEHHAPDVVYGHVVLCDKSGQSFIKQASLPKNYHRMYFCHQSSFVKTTILKNMFFDEKYRMSADFKMMKELFKQKKSFLYINAPIARYDRNGISNVQRAKGLKENIQIIQECDRGMEKIRLLLKIFPSYFFSSVKCLCK